MGRVVYRDNWLTVERVKVKIKGKEVDYTKTTEHDVVIVVPIFDDGKVILEKQLRPILGKSLYELPAGLIEKGEAPLKAAKRELEEETGMSAGKMQYMFEEYSNPGMSKRKFFFYLATDLKKGQRHLDDNEVIKILKLPQKKMDQMIKDNVITDHKTISGYLYYKFLQR